MRSLRVILSIAITVYLSGIGNLVVFAQETTPALSVTVAPVQYASVNGSVAKFRALNWTKDGGDAGISDITFLKQINKDISIEAEGSAFLKTNNNTGHLLLKKDDLAFLQIDYNAFRKYYDGTGGVYPYEINTSSTSDLTTYVDYGKIPDQYQAAQPSSPDLQMDVSFFKLEAGLGPVNDPFLDVAYQHNSKDGNKSLLQWVYAYPSLNGTPKTVSQSYRKIGPAWAAVNNYTDTVTLKEKKEIAGITFKGVQTAEFDYNHSLTYMQYLNDTVSGSQNQLNTVYDNPDAKLFGSGVRAEKWMLNDKTFAALGYHYSHIHSTDILQRMVYTSATLGGVATALPTNSSASGWSLAQALQDSHVWVGNVNSELTSNLTFLADTRYEHSGAEANSQYYPGTALTTANNEAMENHQDNVGEHLALHYSGISHTTLYAETDFQQGRNWVSDQFNTGSGSNPGTDFLTRLNRMQSASWTAGGRIVPNRFFTFTTQVKAHDRVDNYDTISDTITKPGGSTFSDRIILLSSLRVRGVEESSTLGWKPYRWLQNSFRYQFSDNVYSPVGIAATPSDISVNHMLTSKYTYEITVQPIDPLLFMLSYSHVQDYIRSITASNPEATNYNTTPNIPTFNSGYNSWVFSSSYSPRGDLTWNNTVSYTISPNYVNFTNGIPLGSDFRELDFGTGLDWSYRKWLKVSPGYEHASYRDNALTGAGNYSANIFKLSLSCKW
ncbi:MAG: hypothetical protein HQL15_00265 [Candidatus Omnitrophica bacterium]|nr:hypothetical protein [Candidatus Omnitrophota bacterium]